MSKYEYDSDLEFLGKCTDEELGGLFDILVYDKDGKTRNTEELTSSTHYKRYGRKFSNYWEDIAGELQYFGGNTIANIVRGHGVEYEEILDDVLKSLKIDKDDFYDVNDKEDALLQKMFSNMIENMSMEQKKELAKELDLKTLDFSKGAMLIAAQGLIKVGGLGLTRLATFIAGYISKLAIGKVAMAGASRMIGFLTGPIGWGITGAWTLLDIASPAMRVTIPATVMVSCLRKIVEEREKNKNYMFVKCPECGVNLRVRKGAKNIKCPNCEGIFTI